MLVEAMLYRISFWICGFAARLKGRSDGVIVTGGMAHEPYVVGTITERVGFLARFFVYPGEFELEALAEGSLAVLEGRAEVREH